MITKAQRTRLVGLGYSDDQIANVRPQEAHDIIAQADRQGARPASERVRRVTAWGVTFGVIGSAPAGSACLYCGSAEPDDVGGVVIVEHHGRLHEACAPPGLPIRIEANDERCCLARALGGSLALEQIYRDRGGW
jgi:hypothetical protein